ncbi:ABC transporter permease [Telluribacter sp.]|jgi:ABC-type antimicrobial peptide transport system permease subunit|uniref:ABC transporter permease n=1 Tax=Telluribacter sp. TaxID=1978767 RepID=UPI002E1267A9|nr:FtsX-like permease family protein [Telluribacter sp.]
MLTTYLKIAFRILWRNKIYVVVNLVGMGFAIACCLLAYLNYNYRAEFNRNHERTERIYRLNSTRIVEGNQQPWGVSPVPLGEAVQKNLAGIDRIARLHSASVIVKRGEHTFEERIHYSDKALFEFFTFPLKSGNLSGFGLPNQVVISETLAAKYFPGQVPVGKSLTVVQSDQSERVYTVAAVAQKIPDNSSIQFDLITSFENGLRSAGGDPNDWANPTLITTFVEVKDEQIAHKSMAATQPYVAIHNRNRSDWQVANFYLQPFRELATSSDVDMPGYVHGRQLTTNPRGVLVIVPALMSLFILLITCFNFTNISIAFSSGRLKEIGIRKVVGGLKVQLIRQFLTENIILCVLASLIALLFVGMLLPVLNQATELNLTMDFSHNYKLWLFLLLLPLVSAVFSGLYPALYISSFQPVKILKGKTTFGSTNRFSRFLLIAQFGLSCFALIVGIVMTQNASFQKEVDFGYAIQEVAVVEVNSPQEYTAFRQAILHHPQVAGVAGTTHQIGDGSYTAKAALPDRHIQAQVAHVGGEAYLNSMGVRLAQGRHFYESGADAEESILVNETFLKQLNLTQPLGQRIQLDSTYYNIVGVVKDYKEYGLHGLVPPCVLRLARPEEYKLMVVRSNEKELPQVASFLQAAWRKAVPNVPYKGFLQSEMIEKEVRLTQGFKSIAFFLAIVTLLLSASGLFALISLNIDKRSKEIGMRKILGASVWQIVVLINREFGRILLVAFVLGSSLGYLFTSKLIFNFIYKYHPDIGPEAYIATFLIVLLSGSLIIGSRVYRAATANPVNNLRSE